MLMKDVDDPSGRVDKTMDEMLKTKKRFQHYRPQLCPHFILIHWDADNNKNNFF
jgi:hypothetical protein